MELLAFILVSTGLIIIPGPNVLVIISTSISHGKLRGLQTVAGTSAAMLVQLGIAALGTTWLVTALATGLFWLKWLGVIYLVYLGISHILRSGNSVSKPLSATGSLQRGFWVSLTNPKTILFFSAFLPQFANPVQPFLPQIFLLSVIFWLLAVVLDSSYALLSSRLAGMVKSGTLAKNHHRASGLLYLGAGAALAATRQGSAT